MVVYQIRHSGTRRLISCYEGEDSFSFVTQIIKSHNWIYMNSPREQWYLEVRDDGET